jgi:protein SCO1/2
VRNILNILLTALLLVGCSNVGRKLPSIGHPIITGQDTIYSTIKPFTFLSQNSLVVTGKTFDNKIYVADFIFLSCTSICPIMTSEMKKGD